MATTRSTSADHPRVRGEHPKFAPAHATISGSPPRTRGARVVGRLDGDDPRITPAYAGSTTATARRHGRQQDHPRVRGEHCPQCHRMSLHFGSPPRTRGAQRLRDQCLAV